MSTTEFSAIQDQEGLSSSRTEFDRRDGNSGDDQSFGQMFQDAKEYLSGEGGSRILANVTAQVRENPIPFALVGVGLVWLLARGNMPDLPSRSSFGFGREDDDDDDRYRFGADYEFEADDYEYRGAMGDNAAVYSGASHPDYSGTYYNDEDEWTEDYGDASTSGSGSQRRGVLRRAGGAVGSAAGSVGDAVGSAASGVAGAASSVAGGVGSAAGAVAGGVGSAASQIGRGAYSAAEAVASGARYGGTRAYRGVTYVGSSAYGSASDLGGRAWRGVSDAMEGDPLVVGAVAVAAGAVLGALLPRTHLEDEYLGEARDHLWEEAEDLARQKFEQGRHAAEEALRTAKSEASTLAGTGEGSIIGKVGDVARATYDRVREGEAQGGQGGSGAQGSGSQGGGGSVAGGTTATSFGETGSQGTGQSQGGQSSSGSTGGAL